jgi:hypothetical protein
VKQIWTGRVAQTTVKYSENVPTVAVCCNACRTCVTSNVLTVAMGAIAGAGYAVVNVARRRLAKSS